MPGRGRSPPARVRAPDRRLPKGVPNATVDAVGLLGRSLRGLDAPCPWASRRSRRMMARRHVRPDRYYGRMRVVERGSGTPLFLLHGFGVDHRLLLPLDSVIEAVGGWRRIYLDLPGHGGSTVGDASSTEDLVAAVEEEIRDRVGGESFAVLGSSFGGMIARRIVHDFRDQVLGLAVIAAVFVASHANRDVPERVVLSESAAVLRELGEAGDAYAEMAVVHTPDNARAFVEHAYPGLTSADQDALERISEHYALAEEPEKASPAPFTQPTLLVTGRQDQVVGYRDAWARVGHYPRATFVALDAAGHNVHLDQPAVTTALVTNWLERVAAGQ